MYYLCYYCTTSKAYVYKSSTENLLGEYVGDKYFYAAFMRSIDAVNYCRELNLKRGNL